MKWMMDTANMLGLVFEGAAHPYKQNLLKVDGRTRISESEMIKKEVLRSDPTLV